MANGAPASKKSPLETIVPLLMLASPLIELAKPGAGVGVYKGVLDHQQRTQDRNQALVFNLAKDLGNLDEEQLPMVKEALKAQGLAPEQIEAALSLSRVYRDPNAKAKRQLEQVITEEVPGLGAITGSRGDLQNVRIRQAQHQQGLTEETTRFERGQTARQQERQSIEAARQERIGMRADLRGQQQATAASARRVNEVQRIVSQVMLDPRVSPQVRARALALYRLSQKPDADAESLAANAEGILSDATAAIGQVKAEEAAAKRPQPKAPKAAPPAKSPRSDKPGRDPVADAEMAWKVQSQRLAVLEQSKATDSVLASARARTHAAYTKWQELLKRRPARPVSSEPAPAAPQAKQADPLGIR